MARHPFTFRFVRRRYGRKTYTWVFATFNGVEKELGDPWPCVMPKAAEIIATALAVFGVPHP